MAWAQRAGQRYLSRVARRASRRVLVLLASSNCQLFFHKHKLVRLFCLRLATDVQVWIWMAHAILVRPYGIERTESSGHYLALIGHALHIR